MPSTQLRTTDAGPSLEFVDRWSNRVDTGLPVLQTPPIFEVVAPPSVPMYTC